MPLEVRHGKKKTVKYISATRVSENLSRTGLYRELHLRLKHQLTLTAANNLAANFKRGDAWSAIKRLEIIANQNDVIVSLTGIELVMLHRVFYKRWPRFNTNYADQLTANPAVDITLNLPFWLLFGQRPMDTALNTVLLSDCRIEIEWDTFANVNTAATAWTAEPTLDVHVWESFDPAGNTAGIRTAGITRNRNVFQPVGATTDFPAEFTTGPMFAGFIINAASAAGVDEPTRINNLKFRAGGTVLYDLPRQLLQDMNFRNNLEHELSSILGNKLLDSSGGAASDTLAAISAGYVQAEVRNSVASLAAKINSLIRSYANPMVSTSFDQDAWYFLNCIPDGYLTEAPDSLGLSDFTMVADVTGATNLTVIPIGVNPTRKKAA